MLSTTNPVAKVAVEGCDLFLIWALAGMQWAYTYASRCGYMRGILCTCGV